MAVFSVLTIYIYNSGYSYFSRYDYFETSTSLMAFFFPLLVIPQFIWHFIQEMKDGYIRYSSFRTTEKKYVFAKYLVFLSCVGITMISYYLLTLCLSFVIPLELDIMNSFDGHYAANLYNNMPFLLGLLMILWKTFIAALLATFTFILVFLIDNVFVILSAPFAYYILNNVIFAYMQLEKYRLVTSFEPGSLQYTVISLKTFIIPALMLLAIDILISIYISITKTDLLER